MARRAAVRPLKPDRLLATLVKHEVELIVIGGYAVVAHGLVRATKDIDICPSPDKANLRRLAAALKELRAEPLDLVEGIEIEPDFKWLQQTANWTLATRFGRLDVMQDIDGLGRGHGGWKDLEPHAETRRFLGHEVLFCSYEDLIKMKQALGRPQDRVDIADLKAARGEA